MKHISMLLLALGILAAAPSVALAELTEEMKRDGWVSIFDGSTLEGWKSNERTLGFKAEDGAIVGFGGRNHLYYMEELTNFELKIDVNINHDGNSGLYLKSQWQDAAWPTTGFELQINSSHRDPQKTGSLYNIVRIYEAPHKDDEWFTYHVICRGNTLHVRINGKPFYTYVDPCGQSGQASPITEQNKRVYQSGYITLLQHHDGSTVKFRNIYLKKLPD